MERPCPHEHDLRLTYVSEDVAHFVGRGTPGHPDVTTYDLDREDWSRCGSPSALHVTLTFRAT